MTKIAGTKHVKRLYRVDHKAYLQVKHNLDPSHLAVDTDDIYIIGNINVRPGLKVMMLA